MLPITGTIPQQVQFTPGYDSSGSLTGIKNSEDVKKAEKQQNTELTEEEKKEVQKLKKRDQEVKSHESAHKAAGGQYVRGGASYEYQTGPDGKRYAVGGEVSIDTSKEKDPEATIRKMQKVRQAALAPANPSGQDRSVAAAASRKEADARRELTENKKNPDKTEPASTGNKNPQKTYNYSQSGNSVKIPSFASSGKNLNLIA